MRNAISGIVIGAVVVGFSQQNAPAISATALRRDLSAFADDSMLGRYTGSIGAQRATAFLVSRLERAGVRPTLQSLPIVVRQLDLEHARGGDNASYLPGIDFLPLVGAFGLSTPESVTVNGREYVPAGELGSERAVKPDDVAGTFPVFLAPTRANGVPDYQLWDKRNAILSYRKSPALFVTTLDLMPRSFINAMVGPRMVLKERIASLPSSPPIIAFSRGASRKAIGTAHPRITYRTIESNLAYPAQNVVAVIEGSDAVLKSEFVVLSAHIDHLGRDSAASGSDSVYNGANAGSGAIALLALAEDMASRPMKPKRSVVFTWTTGSAQGLLGTEYFADHPTVPREKIVAALSVDRVARTSSKELQSRGTPWISRLPSVCAGDEWHFTRWGIPSARIAGTPHASDDTRGDEIESIDFEGYARTVNVIAELTVSLTDAGARPKVDGAKPDQRTACSK